MNTTIIQTSNVRDDFYYYRRSGIMHVYSFDVVEKEDSIIEYKELYSPRKLKSSELSTLVIGCLNKECDEKILSGFRWKDVPVWLSLENQFNYKALYDMAVQTNGESLPTTIKIGTDDEPEYVTFSTIDEFKEFTQGVLVYIQECIADCWRKKGSIDFDAYGSGLTD